VNPELLRNLWLEFSVRRLIAMPAVLGLIFAVPLIREPTRLPNGVNPMLAASENLEFPTSRLAFGLVMVALLFLWGARLPADSLFSEVNGRTWDNQRSSTIAPWTMTLGKLFGSTAYVWYGALFCLVFVAVQHCYPFVSIVIFVVAALFAHALSLYIALLLLRMAPDRARFRVTLAQFGVLVVVLALLYLFSIQGAATRWHLLMIPTPWFVAASFVLAFIWTLIGANHLMRAELQVQTGPRAWVWFLATVALYLSGFAVQPHVILSAQPESRFLGWLARSLSLAGIGIAFFALVSAFLAPPRLLSLRRWLDAGVFRPRAWALMPSWGWPLIIAGALIAGAAMLDRAGAGLTVFGGAVEGPTVLTATVLMLFVARDIGIIHALTLDPKARRGLFAALVIIALSYFALPFLLSALRLGDLVPLLVPAPLAPPAIAIGAPLVEAILAWMVAARVFHRLRRPIAMAAFMIGVTLAAALAPPARAAFGVDEPCPRTSAHEALLEAGIIFEGRLLSQGPPPACATVQALCAQETVSFQVDRVLKGDAKAGDTVEAHRVSAVAEGGAAIRPYTREAAIKPPLAVPQTGLFVLGGGATPMIVSNSQSQYYTIDECLLTPPAGLAEQADAYTKAIANLKQAVDTAPDDPDKLLALTDRLLRARDNAAARRLLQKAIVAFPANAAVHAQYLYLIDPLGNFEKNPLVWNQMKRQLPDAVIAALETPTNPDPYNAWVRRHAFMVYGEAATGGGQSPGFTDFSAFAFFNPQLGGASLAHAKFADAHIQFGFFRAADLSGADLRWSEFTNVDLSFADLRHADLSDWNPMIRMNGLLIHRVSREPFVINPLSYLTGFVPPKLTLLRARLDGARMDRANLVNADLRQASLKGAGLTDADLRHADLRGADLSGATMSGARLSGAHADCHTIWPDGVKPEFQSDYKSPTVFCAEQLVADEP
jgi:uncharacterized protein YjbI with pentapeptide repeats